MCRDCVDPSELKIESVEKKNIHELRFENSQRKQADDQAISNDLIDSLCVQDTYHSPSELSSPRSSDALRPKLLSKSMQLKLKWTHSV